MIFRTNRRRILIKRRYKFIYIDIWRTSSFFFLLLRFVDISVGFFSRFSEQPPWNMETATKTFFICMGATIHEAKSMPVSVAVSLFTMSKCNEEQDAKWRKDSKQEMNYLINCLAMEELSFALCTFFGMCVCVLRIFIFLWHIHWLGKSYSLVRLRNMEETTFDSQYFSSSSSSCRQNVCMFVAFAWIKSEWFITNSLEAHLLNRFFRPFWVFHKHFLWFDPLPSRRRLPPPPQIKKELYTRRRQIFKMFDFVPRWIQSIGFFRFHFGLEIWCHLE